LRKTLIEAAATTVNNLRLPATEFQIQLGSGTFRLEELLSGSCYHLIPDSFGSN